MAFQPFDLTGRVVLITGGNSGIGLGMAQGLLEAGAEVCIWGTNPEKNAAALAQLEKVGPKVTAALCDVANEEAVNSAFAQVLADHGRVDGCFANAGVGGRGTGFDNITKEEWDHIIGVNQTGVFHTFRAAAKHMRERANNRFEIKTLCRILEAAPGVVCELGTNFRQCTTVNTHELTKFR